MNIPFALIIVLIVIAFIISAAVLAKKQWNSFKEMKVGDIVIYEEVEAEILEKGENNAVIKVRVSGAKLTKKDID